MVSILHRSGNDDAALAHRVAAGDGAAFAKIDERHRRALIRYAGTLLRRSEHDAEDVVQDVLIRAHDALRRGNGPDELRPWLYRLTRNRAIDEVRRARWGDAALDDEAVSAGDGREDPEAAMRRKETVRRLVEDLADLPVRQRTALLARELDDQSPEQVAAQLGVSPAAAQKLVTRARENLIKTRAARDADCPDVRVVLLEAHERGVRSSEHALRHVKGCAACRAYGRDIRRLSRQLHALNPALGLPLLVGLAKLVGGGGAKAAVGVAATLAIATTGGIVVLNSEVHSPGDPAPFRLGGVRTPSGQPVKAGDPVPGGNVVVTARLDVPEGKPPPGQKRSATLPCPRGMRVASYLAPEERVPPNTVRSVGLTNETIFGYSTSGHIELAHGAAPRAFSITVGVLCRRPDATGSIAVNPRRPQRGERPGRICVDQEKVSRTPEYGFQTYANRGQPLAIQRTTASGRWTRVVLDNGVRGWVRSSALCR